MATPGWDNVLDTVPGEIVVVRTEANHGRLPCTFPIFTKRCFEVLGHVSLNCHNDTWIEEVACDAGVLTDVDITVEALRGLIDDRISWMKQVDPKAWDGKK